ncbi:hypothetical protein BJX76DRAFT_354165 [Aspergillus varians]
MSRAFSTTRQVLVRWLGFDKALLPEEFQQALNIYSENGAVKYIIGHDETRIKSWSQPYALDKLKDENIELSDIVKSAQYTFDNYGYGHSWDLEGAAGAFLADKRPPNFVMVSIPICDVKSSYYVKEKDCSNAACYLKKQIFYACAQPYSEYDKWPYDWV